MWLRLEDFFSKAKERQQIYQELHRGRPDDYFYNPDHHKGIVKQFLLFTAYSRKLVQSDRFNYFIILVICIAGVNVGVQTYDELADNKVLNVLDFIILCVFSFEVVVKILSEGLAPQLYFSGEDWKWNNFDFGIVFMSLPFWGGLFGGGSLALLRLVRLMRLAKLIRKIPALQVIVKGLTGGMASIGYIMILLFLVFYLFAVAGYYMFGDNDPFHFSTLPISMMTMFRCATLDAWSDIMYLNIFACDGYDYLYVAEEDRSHENNLFWCKNPKKQFVVAAAYFIVFIIISALVMLSLFIGAVTLSMTDSLNELKQFAEEKKKEKRLEKNVNKLLGNAALLINTRGRSGKMSATPSVRGGKIRSQQSSSSGSGNISQSRTASTKLISVGQPTRSASPVKMNAAAAAASSSSTLVDISNSSPKGSNAAGDPSPGFIFPELPSGQNKISYDDDSASLSTYHHSVGHDHITEDEIRRKSIENMCQDDREHLKSMMQYLEQRRRSTDYEREDDEKKDRRPIISLKSMLPQKMVSYIDQAAEMKALHEYDERARRLKIALGQEAHGFEDEPKSVELFVYRIRHAPTYKAIWLIFAEHCKVLAESDRFVSFVTLVICLAGVNVGAQTDPRITGVPECNLVLNILDIFILAVFTFECGLKIVAEGFQPWIYFKDGWNKFDFVIVVGSYTPGAGSLLTILRLLRLLRVLKLVKSLPQLAVIVNALLMGMSSIGYIGLILFLCFYIFAILGMMLFKMNDPFHFGNLHISMFTLFRCSTLDDWTEVMYVNVYGCDRYPGVYEDFPDMCDSPNARGIMSALYFNIFIMIGAQVLLTLFIGVVTTSMEQAQDIQDKEFKLERQLTTLSNSLELTAVQMRCFRQVFASLDDDNYGTIEGEQLATCLESIEDLLQDMDIDEEVKKADPNGKGIDLITFIIVLCNIKTCRHQRVLRRAVRNWKRNKKKRGKFFFRKERTLPPRVTGSSSFVVGGGMNIPFPKLTKLGPPEQSPLVPAVSAASTLECKALPSTDSHIIELSQRPSFDGSEETESMRERRITF